MPFPSMLSKKNSSLPHVNKLCSDTLTVIDLNFVHKVVKGKFEPRKVELIQVRGARINRLRVR